MAKISKLIENTTGKTEEDRRLLEQLTFLQKMAKAKSETFESELKLMLSSDAIGQPEIVGKRAFRYHNNQHVNISTSCDEAITDAINDLFKGEDGVKDGFQRIVKQSLSGLIEDTSVGESEEHMFFVYPENNAVVRVDVKAYKYTFSGKGLLAEDADNVFAYTMANTLSTTRSLPRTNFCI